MPVDCTVTSADIYTLSENIGTIKLWMLRGVNSAGSAKLAEPHAIPPLLHVIAISMVSTTTASFLVHLTVPKFTVHPLIEEIVVVPTVDIVVEETTAFDKVAPPKSIVPPPPVAALMEVVMTGTEDTTSVCLTSNFEAPPV